MPRVVSQEILFQFDEALEIAGSNGRYQFWVTFVVTLAAISVASESQSMGTVLPSAKCELNMTVTEQGLINSISYIGIAISSHFWGLTTDTWGRPKTLRLALLLSLLFSIISSLSLSTWMLLVCRLIVGISSSGIKVSSLVYASDFLIDKQRSKYFSIIVTATTCGLIFYSALALLIFSYNIEFSFGNGWNFRSWRVMILAGNSIAATSFFGLIFLSEGPKYDYLMNRKLEAIKTLSEIYSINHRKPKSLYPVKKLHTSKLNGSNFKETHGTWNFLKLAWKQTKPIFIPPHVYNLIILCILTFILSAVAQGISLWYLQILVYFTSHLNESQTTCQIIDMSYLNIINSTLNSSSSDIDKCQMTINPLPYLIILILYFLEAFICIFITFGMQRCGPTKLLSINMNTSWIVISCIGSLCILWTKTFIIQNIAMVAIISLVAGTFILVPICGEIFPSLNKGMVLSLVFMTGRTGSIFGINMIGAMIYTACSTIFAISSGLLLLCAILAFTILKKTEKKKIEFIDKDENNRLNVGDET